MRDITIAVIGGDMRFAAVAKTFLKHEGVKVLLSGFEKAESVFPCSNPYDAAAACDVAILPLPCSTDGQNVNSPYSERGILLSRLFRSMGGNTLVFGGSISAAVQELAEENGFQIIDYLNREELAVLNAVPTAEGALEIAMRESATTLWGQNALICGFGRIGKTLAADLKSLGANVTVCARRESDLAWCAVNGYESLTYDRLHDAVGDFSLIFNTVPAMIFDEETLQSVSENALIIDLASKPGGVDFESAKRLSVRTVWALSLPGKVAPVTAGQMIARTIAGILREKSLL